MPKREAAGIGCKIVRRRLEAYWLAEINGMRKTVREWAHGRKPHLPKLAGTWSDVE